MAYRVDIASRLGKHNATRKDSLPFCALKFVHIEILEWAQGESLDIVVERTTEMDAIFASRPETGIPSVDILIPCRMGTRHCTLLE